MQFYALDEKGAFILADDAIKGQNYHCLECASLLRPRKSLLRQSHFYHPRLSNRCRLSRKGPLHLKLQASLCATLPGAVLEKRFSEIGRIADVAWLSEKLIFEIQCAPISIEEVLARTADYSSIGYEVVWILYEKRYNKAWPSPIEHALKEVPHYFANEHFIYDQYATVDKGKKTRSPALKVDLSKPEKQIVTNPFHRNWKIHFEGDLISKFLKGDEQYIKQALAARKRLHWREWLKSLCQAYVKLIDGLLT